MPNISRRPEKASPAVTGEGHFTLFFHFLFLSRMGNFPLRARDVLGQLLGPDEGLPAADADVVQGLCVLDAVSQ